MLQFRPEIKSLTQVEEELHERGKRYDDTSVYVSTATRWWTHRVSHVARIGPTGFMCDPCGFPAKRVEDWRMFLAELRSSLEKASEDVKQYGERLLLASHHMCSYDDETYLPFAEVGFAGYVLALKRYDQRIAFAKAPRTLSRKFLRRH